VQQSTLITAIRDRLLADTGTGGLFNVTTPLLTDVHFARANKHSPSDKYIVLVVANTTPEDDMDNDLINFEINVNIYLGTVYGNAPVLSNIIDRVYDLLHDWTPTLSAWTPSGPLVFDSGGSVDLPDDDSLSQQITFTFKQSKARSPS
jgi:hypothetical protein